MTVVIDVGCARWGGDYSVERLIEEYEPDVVYGFDPAKDVAKAMPRPLMANITVALHRAAAWTFDGQVGYREDGLNSWITELKGAPQVRCVDIARVVREVAPGHMDVILKIDAEGSEYDLLRHLMVTGADQLLTLAVVEWHEPDRGRALIEEHFACPVKEWPY